MSTFLDRLDGEAQKLLLAVARPVSHASGERLVRYGEAARGAFVLKSGAAEASVLLPGGEKLTVAKLGPGSVFGEMALLERGVCMATVLATANLDGWFLDRDDFRALAAQRAPEARRLRHALTLILAGKLRAMNAKVLEASAPEDKPAARAKAADPLAGVKRVKKTGFDVRPFLPLLPAFEGFDEAEIAEVLDVSRLLELPGGHGLFGIGQPSSVAAANSSGICTRPTPIISGFMS